MIPVSSISRIPVTDAWPDEARDFTPWLGENISALGETLGMDLELVQIEAPVGAFSLDILATEIGTRRNVVIENQYGKTNHDHLGKLLTYAAGYDADVVVWIAQEIREEHQQAMEWLNNHSGTNVEFYGIVIELLKIDDSKPAYNFEVVARPNEFRKDRAAEINKRPLSKREKAYKEFFQSLLDRLRLENNFTKTQRSQPNNYYAFSSGIPGLSYVAGFNRQKRVSVDLYIDTSDKSFNKKKFDELNTQSESIEDNFGVKLSWLRMDNKRASRIVLTDNGDILDSKEDLSLLEDWFVENLLKFKSVLGPIIADL